MVSVETKGLKNDPSLPHVTYTQVRDVLKWRVECGSDVLKWQILGRPAWAGVALVWKWRILGRMAWEGVALVLKWQFFERGAWEGVALVWKWPIEVTDFWEGGLRRSGPCVEVTCWSDGYVELWKSFLENSLLPKFLKKFASKIR